jgi:hypothetical protein
MSQVKARRILFETKVTVIHVRNDKEFERIVLMSSCFVKELMRYLVEEICSVLMG